MGRMQSLKAAKARRIPISLLEGELSGRAKVETPRANANRIPPTAFLGGPA